MKDKNPMKIKLFITLAALLISGNCFGSDDGWFKTQEDVDSARSKAPLIMTAVIIVDRETNSTLLQKNNPQWLAVHRIMEISDQSLSNCARIAAKKKGVEVFNLTMLGDTFRHVPSLNNSHTAVTIYTTASCSGTPSSDLKWFKQSELPATITHDIRSLLYNEIEKYKRR